jgi:hypothetical protein
MGAKASTVFDRPRASFLACLRKPAYAPGPMDAIRIRGTRKLAGGYPATEQKLALVGAAIERINLSDEDR